MIAIFAEGDWRFQAFILKAWGKYPENPVDPVQKGKNKIESIPYKNSAIMLLST